MNTNEGVLAFPIRIAGLAIRTFSASELGVNLAELSDSKRQIFGFGVGFRNRRSSPIRRLISSFGWSKMRA